MYLFCQGLNPHNWKASAAQLSSNPPPQLVLSLCMSSAPLHLSCCLCYPHLWGALPCVPCICPTLLTKSFSIRFPSKTLMFAGIMLWCRFPQKHEGLSLKNPQDGVGVGARGEEGPLHGPIKSIPLQLRVKCRSPWKNTHLLTALFLKHSESMPPGRVDLFTCLGHTQSDLFTFRTHPQTTVVVALPTFASSGLGKYVTWRKRFRLWAFNLKEELCLGSGVSGLGKSKRPMTGAWGSLILGASSVEGIGHRTVPLDFLSA